MPGMGRGWKGIRRKILERDVYCAIGSTPEGERLRPECEILATEVDHIVPRAVGIDNDPSNLRGVCRPCHQGRTSQPRNSRDWAPHH